MRDIIQNIKEIREQYKVSQQDIADFLNVDVSSVSNILSGKRELRYSEVEKIAKALKVDPLYLITYPDVYEKRKTVGPDPVEAILQIRLQSDKKDQVLKLIFGENNIEILNK